jgi:hypothetical protein
VVNVTDSYGRILGSLDRSRYLFFQAARRLYPRGSVDPVADPLISRKSGIAGNRTRNSGSVATRAQRRSPHPGPCGSSGGLNQARVQLTSHFHVIRNGCEQLGHRETGLRVPARSRTFSSPYRRDRLWGPPSGHFLRSKISRGV